MKFEKYLGFFPQKIAMGRGISYKLSYDWLYISNFLLENMINVSATEIAQRVLNVISASFTQTRNVRDIN